MKLPRSTILRTMVVGMIVLVVAALGATVALAHHIAPVSLTASTLGCSVNYTAEWGAYANETSVRALAVGYVNGKQAGEKYVELEGYPADYSTTSGKVWIGHSEWDSIDFYINDASVALDWNCTTGEPQNWWFSVLGLPGSSPSASVPAADGSLACALFDVQGWGAKTVNLTDYPDCSGEVTVMCLDGDGNWTDGNVHNFAQDGTVVTFMSSQHGTCAFFEK